MLTSLIVSSQHSISIFLKTNVHFLNPSTVTLLSHQSNSIHTRIYLLILHHCWIRILQPTIIILSLRYRNPYLRNMITVVEFRERKKELTSPEKKITQFRKKVSKQERMVLTTRNRGNFHHLKCFLTWKVSLIFRTFP